MREKTSRTSGTLRHHGRSREPLPARSNLTALTLEQLREMQWMDGPVAERVGRVPRRNGPALGDGLDDDPRQFPVPQAVAGPAWVPVPARFGRERPPGRGLDLAGAEVPESWGSGRRHGNHLRGTPRADSRG